jgi:hypothetical protein
MEVFFNIKKIKKCIVLLFKNQTWFWSYQSIYIQFNLKADKSMTFCGIFAWKMDPTYLTSWS